MTSAPPALTGLLAALMLAIGVYCATRPLTARWKRRSTYADVDIMHAVMGVGMAGMLLPWLNPFQPVVWEAAFAAGAAWFGARAGWARWKRRAAVAPRAGWGQRKRHAAAGSRPGHSCSVIAPGGCTPAAHLLSCGAMLYMLASAARGGVAAAPDGRHATAAMAARPGFLAVLLAAAVAVSVVVATDRLALPVPARAARPVPAQPVPTQPQPVPAQPQPVPAQHSRAQPVPAQISPPRPAPALHSRVPHSRAQVGPLPPGRVPHVPAESGQGRAGRGRPGRFGRFVNTGRGRGPGLCPRVASCCQIAMGITMAYMLIQMG